MKWCQKPSLLMVMVGTLARRLGGKVGSGMGRGYSVRLVFIKSHCWWIELDVRPVVETGAQIMRFVTLLLAPEMHRP